MSIAFVGHGYHEKTKSSLFMLDFLRQHFPNVDLFYDYSPMGGPSLELEPIAEAGYDLIIVWQMEMVAKWFAERVPARLVFVPMYDGARYLELEFWSAFQNTRVLTFSQTLHELLQKFDVPSLKVQYFPDPSTFAPVTFADFRGFFWQRRQEIAWPLIKRLFSGTRLAGFTLHLALDPGFGEPSLPDPEEMTSFGITLSHWCEDRATIDAVLARSNIYFAPRPCEGIGMSFLEAMARGQCVVSPNAPTMSEYMTHGVSGLLYDEKDPEPLDFSNAAAIGAAARRKVGRGFVQWEKDKSELLPEFFFGGREKAHALLKSISLSRVFSEGAVRKPEVSKAAAPKVGGRRLNGLARADRDNEPLVTVAMVTRNAYASFRPTLKSIQSQTYRNFEVLVVDGASNDGTLELIERSAEGIDYWVSEPDQGPYDGMNKAAELARGRYILFMNAGDLFTSERALAEAMEEVSDGDQPDFIFGHHIYVTKDGIEEFHRANDFADTWRNMREGRYSWGWLSGVPCHQSTLTRTVLLRDNRYDLSWAIAADHEFMYRMRAKGASFHHSDTTVAIYFSGGFSAQNEARCHDEWWRLMRAYGDEQKADAWFGKSQEVATSGGWRALPRAIAARVLAVLRGGSASLDKG
jgi:hypothetical protein